MSSNINSSNRSDEPLMPELERAGHDVLNRAMFLGERTRNVRSNIFNLLGKEEGNKYFSREWNMRLRRPENRQIYTITQNLLRSRAGIREIIGMKGHSTLAHGPSGYPEGISNYVSDPESEEANVVAWLYNQYVNAANAPEYADLFERVDARQLQNAKRMLELKKLLENEEYLSLGIEGTISGGVKPQYVPGSSVVIPATATTPASTKETKSHVQIGRPPDILSGEGRIRQAQIKFAEAKHKADIETIKDSGNPSKYENEAKEAQKEIEGLQKKKSELQRKLLAIGKGMDPPLGWDMATIEDVSTDIVPKLHAVPALSRSMAIGRQTKTIEEWINSDELEGTVQSMEERFRYAGTGRPPSRIILNAFMKKHYGPSLAGASEDEQKKFYKDMESLLLTDRAAIPEEQRQEESQSTLRRAGKATWGATKATARYVFWDYFTKRR